MVAQGAKRVMLGDDTYVYDAHHYLITSVHLPTFVQVIAILLSLFPRWGQRALY
jgi:AraC-type transcriptional regulator N-terminus